MSRQTTMIVLFSALIVIISMGTRQAFGLFLQPVSDDLAVGRESFSLAMALQNIIYGLPLMAIVADRYGSRWVMVGGALLYALGLLMMSTVSNPTMLYLTLGLLVGIALSSTSFVIILGGVAQMVPKERRTTAFGIITAAGSFGMFSVVPGTQWLLSSFGWQRSFMLLAFFVGLIALFAPPVSPRKRVPQGSQVSTLRKIPCRKSSSRHASTQVTGYSMRVSLSVAFMSPLSPLIYPPFSPIMALPPLPVPQHSPLSAYLTSLAHHFSAS